MKIAIVDDEKSCREELERQLLAFGGANRQKLDPVPFPSAEAFLASLGREHFPMVFMDIFMDGMDGVAAAAKLRETDKRCLLIFLTSSEDFRPNALSVHAFEYIVKPFSPDRVAAVLEDALAVLPPEAEYIEVASGRKTVLLLLENILSAVTDAHYVDIGLANGSVVRSRLTIQEFLALTQGDPRFITVNKGIVLNADHVSQFEGNCCVMENGTRFPIRVRDRVQVEQAVHKYRFAKIRGRQRHGREGGGTPYEPS